MHTADAWSVIFELLQKPIRRQLLWSLHNQKTDEKLDSRQALEEEPITDEKKIALQNIHLPKLEHYNHVVVEGFMISRGPDWDTIEPVLSVLLRNKDELPKGLIPS